MTSVTLWGTRGSLATPGPDTARFGGNTSCVEVRGNEDRVLVLDAGTGIRRLGDALMGHTRVDLLLTHLHMDHIQGLGFFAPLHNPEAEVHVWGPAGTTLPLWERLGRYLSPPLFPVLLRDVSCSLHLHEVCRSEFDVEGFHVTTNFVCHPGPTVGYRIEDEQGATVTYLPDHEPALGLNGSYLSRDWTSGYALARNTSLLIHDAQYTDDEYSQRMGYGHSSLRQALAFAQLVGAERLVPFHHDPSHDDTELEALVTGAIEDIRPSFPVIPAAEGASFPL